MKRLVIIVTILHITSCVSTEIEKYGRKVVDFCTKEITRISTSDFYSEVDHAYVYVQKNGAWVIFTRGELGTFGERDADSKVLFNCGVLNDDPMRAVFIDQPFKKVFLETQDKNGLTDPTGSIELKFRRVNGEFNYCCSQPFDEKNFDTNNYSQPSSSQTG